MSTTLHNRSQKTGANKSVNSGSQKKSISTYRTPSTGILSKVPPSCVPYLELSRIDRSNGFYGFYLTHLIGLGWGASLEPTVITVPQLVIAASVIAVWLVWHRGAACSVNDILDRELDKQVERCRNRPMAREAISVPAAWSWYAVQVVIASLLCLAIIPYGSECLYHATPMLFLVSVYPLFKRWTDFPQLVLGVPLCWAVLMSCTALGLEPWTTQTTPQLWASLCLCASEFIRIVVLDYVNACQDSEDDIKAGVKSMAVRYWNTAKFIFTMGGAQVLLLVVAGLLTAMSPVYFVIGVGGNIAMIAWMGMTVDRKHPETCAWWFQHASLYIGGMSVVALFSEYAFRAAGGASML